MTKIFWPNSGSQQSWRGYQEYSLDKAIGLVHDALNEKRIVVDIYTNKWITNSEDVKNNSVIRVYPLVGGG